MRSVLIVFGPQGSGKSTQVKHLAQKYNLKVFEAGAKLRELSIVDENIHQQITSGQLVSNQILRQLVEDYVSQLPSDQGIIFDGYPRNQQQCQDFKELVEKYDWQVTLIYIHLSDKSAKSRLSMRFQLIDGKKIYREDDKPEIVERRLVTFRKETLPVKDWLAEHYRSIEIDGEPAVDAVTDQINRALEPIIND
ncbi:MAG: nucleoside monophosphate kinase [Patescibacteria group bacterium]